MIEFKHENPVTLFFGENQIDDVVTEIVSYGTKVLLILGGKSFKSNGHYLPLVQKMQQAGLKIHELEGNKFPSLSVVRKGIALCKDEKIDFVLGIGGGVCMDLAKTIAFGTKHPFDIWEYLTGAKEYDSQHLPIGTIVTYPSSGSEMDGATQITNDVTKEQAGLSGIYPNFSWLNPRYVMSVPNLELAYGQITSFVQMSINFLSLENSSVSETVSIALMKEILKNLETALENPLNVEVRSNMLISSALNVSGITGFGKSGDWSMYPLQGILQEYYQVNYTRAITTLFPYWLKMIYKSENIFKKYFEEVLGLNTNELSENELLNHALNKLSSIYQKFGLATTFKEIKEERGDREELYKIVKNMGNISSQYGELTTDDILYMFKQSIG